MIAAGNLYNIIVEIESRGSLAFRCRRRIKLNVAYYVTVGQLDNTVGVLLGKLAVMGNDYYKLCFGKLFKGVENLTSCI